MAWRALTKSILGRLEGRRCRSKAYQLVKKVILSVDMMTKLESLGQRVHSIRGWGR